MREANSRKQHDAARADLELLICDVAVAVGVNELPHFAFLVCRQFDIEPRQAADEFATIDSSLTR